MAHPLRVPPAPRPQQGHASDTVRSRHRLPGHVHRQRHERVPPPLCPREQGRRGQAPAGEGSPDAPAPERAARLRAPLAPVRVAVQSLLGRGRLAASTGTARRLLRAGEDERAGWTSVDRSDPGRATRSGQDLRGHGTARYVGAGCRDVQSEMGSKVCWRNI